MVPTIAIPVVARFVNPMKDVTMTFQTSCAMNSAAIGDQRHFMNARRDEVAVPSVFEAAFRASTSRPL